MSEDIISIKTRQVFREYMVDRVLREITDEFDAARVDCDLSFQPNVSGQRRTLIEQYYHTVDWTNEESVRRVLGVYETILHKAQTFSDRENFGDDWQDEKKAEYENLLHFLRKDGFDWVGGRIVKGAGVALLNDLKEIAQSFDAKHLNDLIHRMESSVEIAPALAIGTAKELIESCCKTILAERGKPVSGTPKISDLTKKTLKELQLVPEDIEDSAKGADVIKRLLNNLGTIGNNISELRGLYGTGHGKDGKAKGLAPRHAKLAVGSAATLATFLFETHKAKEYK